MHCLKCGREIEEHQSFCADCQETMKNSPVPSDIVVHIPRRPEAKRAIVRKRGPTAEEQLKKARKSIVRLRVALALLLVVSALLTYLSIETIQALAEQNFLGKNYSTVETGE